MMTDNDITVIAKRTDDNYIRRFVGNKKRKKKQMKNKINNGVTHTIYINNKTGHLPDGRNRLRTGGWRMACMLATVGLMSSCGIYNRYSRPELDIDTTRLIRETAAMTATEQAGTGAIVSDSWRELFTDSHLRELITTALERNTDLTIARLQTQEAQAALLNAKLSYLPSVSLNPQAGISQYNGETKKTYNIGATASWEIDAFGKVTNARRGARAAVEQGRAYEQAVAIQLVATVADSYYTLLMLDEQLAIARETLTNWDETIRTLEALNTAGRTNEVAVHQARANRTALEAQMISIGKSISSTENSLSALLKEPAHSITRGTLDGQHFADCMTAGVKIERLAGRPDVRQAEAALAEAFYATNAARSAFYPSLTLSGSLGWTNNGGGSITNPGKWLSSAVAALTAPLFNRGTNIANLQIARARQEEAKLRFEQALLNAGNEANDALTAWQTADRRIALDRQQIEELESATEKTRLLVRYTSANYLEVLTAQQALLNARLTLAEDRISKIQAVVELYHALGGGS